MVVLYRFVAFHVVLPKFCMRSLKWVSGFIRKVVHVVNKDSTVCRLANSKGVSYSKQ